MTKLHHFLGFLCVMAAASAAAPACIRLELRRCNSQLFDMVFEHIRLLEELGIRTPHTLITLTDSNEMRLEFHQVSLVASFRGDGRCAFAWMGSDARTLLSSWNHMYARDVERCIADNVAFLLQYLPERGNYAGRELEFVLGSHVRRVQQPADVTITMEQYLQQHHQQRQLYDMEEIHSEELIQAHTGPARKTVVATM